MMFSRSMFLRALTLTLLASVGRVAEAADLGLRGGFATESGVTQIIAGAQITFEGIANSKQAVFEPNAMVGFGNGFSSLLINAHFKYLIPIQSNLTAYPLAGPGLIVVSAGEFTGTGVGVNVGGGISSGRLGAELTVGFGDVYSITATASYTLRHR